MTEKIIQDWLAESAALSPVEVDSLANSLKHNNDLIEALYEVLDDHTKFRDLIDPISKHLFNYYRSRELELRLFTLQFLPNLIFIYLNAVACVDKKSYRSIETLLIGIYNLEVVDETGQPTVISFRLPSLAQASIYHEPMSLAHASLTESALRRLEECNTKLIRWGPHPQVETLNAQNRMKTITGLVFIYNRNIGSLNRESLSHLCKVASRYNDFGHEAMQAVIDIYDRSCFECYANVIVVANAIRNSSNITSKGQADAKAMGISVALSPATNTVTTVNKFMITNASFRTKKLPDDLELEIQSNVSPRRSSDDSASATETHYQKSTRKGKWKGWNWLHNPSNRCLAEDQEETSPKKKSSENGAQTSPVVTNKSNSRRNSADVQTRHKGDEFTTNIPPFGSDSPKRRALKFVNSSPNRMSAGARLCKVFEEDALSFSDAEDLDGDTKTDLFVSGRPSSFNLAGAKQV